MPEAPVSSWLLSNIDLIPRAGRALDVACGRGRHALFLAARGWTVRALDGDALSIDALRSEAARRGLAVQADVVDLEAGAADLGREAYDLIVVVHYLHRPLFPALLRALAPGGLLVYALPLLTVGGTVVIMRRWDPARLLQLVSRERVTMFFCVPTQYQDLLA